LASPQHWVAPSIAEPQPLDQLEWEEMDIQQRMNESFGEWTAAGPAWDEEDATRKKTNSRGHQGGSGRTSSPSRRRVHHEKRRDQRSVSPRRRHSPKEHATPGGAKKRMEIVSPGGGRKRYTGKVPADFATPRRTPRRMSLDNGSMRSDGARSYGSQHSQTPSGRGRINRRALQSSMLESGLVTPVRESSRRLASTRRNSVSCGSSVYSRSDSMRSKPSHKGQDSKSKYGEKSSRTTPSRNKSTSIHPSRSHRSSSVEPSPRSRGKSVSVRRQRSPRKLMSESPTSVLDGDTQTTSEGSSLSQSPSTDRKDLYKSNLLKEQQQQLPSLSARFKQHSGSSSITINNNKASDELTVQTSVTRVKKRSKAKSQAKLMRRNSTSMYNNSCTGFGNDSFNNSWKPDFDNSGELFGDAITVVERPSSRGVNHRKKDRESMPLAPEWNTAYDPFNVAP